MNRISVIVPIYYGEKYIEPMISQIEACKMHLGEEDHIEILFVNDAPDAPILQKWNGKAIDVIVINTEENEGIHGARLKGMSRSHGNYILFLDQDDKIKPEFFCSQMQAIGGYDGVVCRAIDNGKPYYSDSYIFEKMITKAFIIGEWNSILSPGQVLLKRKSIPIEWTENVLSYNGADDWFLWLCMIGKGCRFSLNQEVLYEHVRQNANTSDDLLSMMRSEQEVIGMIREKRIFSDEDIKLLVNGFLQKYTTRMGELYDGLKKVRRHDRLLEDWMYLKDNGTDFSLFLKKYGYQRIAIYGAGRLGIHLFYELRDSDIDISFAIDKKGENIMYPIHVYSPSQQMPPVDAIVITIIDEYEEISRMLGKKQNCTIVSLEEIIQELMSG